MSTTTGPTTMQTPSPLSADTPAIKTASTPMPGTEDSISYTPLDLRFRHDGFDFQQVTREGDLAIFSQSRGGTVIAYEVVRIRRHEGFSVASRTIPPGESYPSSEKWGIDGWTFSDRETAFTKLRAMIAME